MIMVSREKIEKCINKCITRKKCSAGGIHENPCEYWTLADSVCNVIGEATGGTLPCYITVESAYRRIEEYEESNYNE